MKESVDDEYDRGSFRLDPQAKSFQMTGFRWRDAPVLLVSLVLSFVLLSGVNLAMGFGLAFLNRDVVLIAFGATLGYFIGVVIGARRITGNALLHREIPLPQVVLLSDRVKAIANQPNRLIEAVKLYQEESGADLADAKAQVEAYLNR